MIGKTLILVSAWVAVAVVGSQDPVAAILVALFAFGTTVVVAKTK
jgi:hypothetical protein